MSRPYGEYLIEVLDQVNANKMRVIRKDGSCAKLSRVSVGALSPLYKWRYHGTTGVNAGRELDVLLEQAKTDFLKDEFNRRAAKAWVKPGQRPWWKFWAPKAQVYRGE